jgi:hypothetical protein
VRTRAMTIRSSRFKAEMETFIWNNGRPEARSGRRDDLIMAAALAAWVRDNYYGGVYNTPDLTAAMLGAMKVNKTQNTQIQGASKNPDHVPVRSLGVFSQPQNPYLMRLPNGQYVDMGSIVGIYAPRKG